MSQQRRPCSKAFIAAAVLADRAQVAGNLRQRLDRIGAVFPSPRSHKAPIPRDPLLFKLHNRVE